uniref:Putative LOV domain-containing protein n=1 Tax=Pilularia globulifera TaxID=49509 RepID=A0A126WZB4_9MONI|nr:putative LOV domain-containing protein [Pilularia globulifera]
MGFEVRSCCQNQSQNAESGLGFQETEESKTGEEEEEEEEDDDDDYNGGDMEQLDVNHTHNPNNIHKFQSYTPSGDSLPELVMTSFTSTYKDSLREALQCSEFNFVLTDPRVQDNPIVYASDGFLKMTGYTAEEVLGRNCRFLQGTGTDRRTIMQIRDAIREERACQVSILNYTKDGQPFWNLFHMAPVYSREDGRVVHFLGVQTPLNSGNGAMESKELLQGVHCFCLPGAESAEHHQHHCADSLKASFPAEIDEDECEVGQLDRERAKYSVKSLMSEITSKCKGAGVSETRCPGPGSQRVVCSSLMLSLTKVQQSFVLANPHLPDMPIVHASDLFLKLSGYSREEVVGRNCRFLQGPDTDPEAVRMIREAIEAEKSCTVRLLNYRKDKTPFWNLLHLAPVRSNLGKVAFYVGVQLEATSLTEDETAPDIKQLGAVGAVKVAVRSLQGEGLCRVRKNE